MAEDDTTNVDTTEEADDGTQEILGDDDNEQHSTVPMRILSIDVDEDNQQELGENQVPVKMSVSLGDAEDQSGTGEKPPTPMPEWVNFEYSTLVCVVCTCACDVTSGTRLLMRKFCFSPSKLQSVCSSFWWWIYNEVGDKLPIMLSLHSHRGHSMKLLESCERNEVVGMKTFTLLCESYETKLTGTTLESHETVESLPLYL